MKIIGNESLAASLLRLAHTKKLPHALLFTGRDGIGKGLHAEAVAKVLLESSLEEISSHPDAYILKPDTENGLHSIEQIRTLIREAYLSPLVAQKKVFILHDVERMSPVSANALLKTLEEPPHYCIMMLLSSAPHEVLDTIQSRCATLFFQPLPQQLIAAKLEEKGVSSQEAARFARASLGSLGWALEQVSDTRFQQAQKLFFQMLSGARSPFEAIPEIEELLSLFRGTDYSKRATQLIHSYLLWIRDLECAKLTNDVSLLYASNTLGITAPSIYCFKEAQARVAKSKLALERNSSLAACLYFLL